MSSENEKDMDDLEGLGPLGHRMVDDFFQWLKKVPETSVWKPVPQAVRQEFQDSVPLMGQGAEQAYQDFLDQVLKQYAPLNLHPRFWGWVIGSGTPLGALADMLASGLNPLVDGGNHISTAVEGQVLDWCKAMMGFPKTAGALLVSGCSIANLTGLAVARNQLGPDLVRREGLRGLQGEPVLYTSAETHSSVQKAVELLGLGKKAIHRIPVNEAFQINTKALQTAISEDRKAGLMPFCIVGNAGTTNTGAVDDLQALAGIAAKEKLWLHVDGAFGALARLVPGTEQLLKGLELADSLAFDLHKWMYLPYGVGCILVRDSKAQLDTFSLSADYLEHDEPRFSDYGIELSRPFRALKIWLCLKAYGLETYHKHIGENIEAARYLGRIVSQQSGLELIAPVSLNVVCFRFCGQGDMKEAVLEQLNRQILMALQMNGQVLPSSTKIRGRFTIRVALTNHRTTRTDLELLVREVVRLGKKLNIVLKGL